jgi:hypothetical protein
MYPTNRRILYVVEIGIGARLNGVGIVQAVELYASILK